MRITPNEETMWVLPLVICICFIQLTTQREWYLDSVKKLLKKLNFVWTYNFQKDKRGESIDTIPSVGICTYVLDKSVFF